MRYVYTHIYTQISSKNKKQSNISWHRYDPKVADIGPLTQSIAILHTCILIHFWNVCHRESLGFDHHCYMLTTYQWLNTDHWSEPESIYDFMHSSHLRLFPSSISGQVSATCAYWNMVGALGSKFWNRILSTGACPNLMVSLKQRRRRHTSTHTDAYVWVISWYYCLYTEKPRKHDEWQAESKNDRVSGCLLMPLEIVAGWGLGKH